MVKQTIWNGDPYFLLRKLVAKDFRVRYRNMSLGALWSLLNPIIMTLVLTFVFTNVFPNSTPNYPLFVLCGIVPFNFFSLAWGAGTSSLVENVGLVKRVAIPRQVVVLASILSNSIHVAIQLALLVSLAVLSGKTPNIVWIWLPVILGLEILFVYGLALATASINVFVRDMRYIVESVSTILFWLVPVFYSFEAIPPRYADLYQFNPIAAVVLASRGLLIHGHAPSSSLMLKLALVSVTALVLGRLMFSRLEHRFYDYL